MGFHQASYEEPILFELGAPGRRGNKIPDWPIEEDLVPPSLERSSGLELPNISEPEIVRHFTRLSQMNHGVDSGFYPLGSCTMKYTPKITDDAAALPQAIDIHPDQHPSTAQGNLQLMYELQEMLKVIAGVDDVTLQPAAGAHGEYTGLLLVRAYHDTNGDSDVRKEVILPDTSHGTNPASASMAGYTTVQIPSKDGCVDLDALKSALSDKTAAFMITNPNTLGLFETDICTIAKMVHEAGALLYYDGANLNAIMGKVRPGDMGFDIVHFNLHKTFSTPHGGGGPGAGPIGVKKELSQFLPVPLIIRGEDGSFDLDFSRPMSIGKVRSHHGSFGILLRAWVYIKVLGGDGLTQTSEVAVLNSNYLKERIKDNYVIPHRSLRKHEFVTSCEVLKKSKGIRALDVAKRLSDYGFHAPTVYFPLCVPEALMIEPTESETKETLDAYADALNEIANEDPEIVRSAPHSTSVTRVDEVAAAKNAILSYRLLKEYEAKEG